MAAPQPAVLKITLAIPAKTGIEDYQSLYCDISQCCSVLNRRFYRQGVSWAVDSFKLIAGPNTTGSLETNILQTTWMMYNSWVKTYSAWQKQAHTAMKDGQVQSTMAAHRDFKIFFDATHADAGVVANLTPADSVLQPYLLGDWDASQIVIPNDGGTPGNTIEYSLHMHGADVAAPGGSKAMIQNYAESRAYPFSPDPDIENPELTFFSEMVDVGQIQDEVIENATDRNNDLPYTATEYPGGAVNAPLGQNLNGIVLNTQATTNGHFLKGGIIPCGLLHFSHDLSQDTVLEINLVPGMERGYLTQPMGGA